MDTIILVKDWITKQPIEGAHVQLLPEIGEPHELFTDETGEANFGEVMTGRYRVTVDHRDYSPGTVMKMLPDTVQIELVSLGAVAASVLSIVGVALIVGTKALGWW